MPTLSIFKKKRTKDLTSPNDPNSPSSPVDTSPTIPTSAVGIRNSVTSTSTHTLSSQSQGSSNQGTDDTLIAQTPLSQGISQQSLTSAPRNTGQEPTMSSHPQPQPQTQNAPTINSMINPPQNDGGVESQSEGQSNGSNARGVAATSTPVSSAPAVRVTKGKYTLSDFTIKRTLGTGSFGRVHLVQSNHNHRFYAVKVLKKQQVVKMKQIEHTNDERRMLQKVKHAFLVTLWGTFQDSKNLYMVMDFVEGGELFSLLRKSQVSDIRSFRILSPVLFFFRVYKLTGDKAFSQSCCQILCRRSHIGS